MILNVKNFKYSTQKTVRTNKKFSKVAGYKINMQKSVVFLYTSNKLLERELKQTIPFIIGLEK